MAGCPSDDTVAAYVDGLLPHAEITELERHIDDCRECRLHLSSLARQRQVPRSFVSEAVTQSEPGSPTALTGGVRIGRLVVLGPIGQGGMGQVVEAYDPELERHVAVKVLDLPHWQNARERLQREAIAMARLAHPNVVMVFDVGSWGDQLYVAMELVSGSTLDAWVRDAKPSWREIVDACIAAGRGLAAAHAAGIIHRDFKPANVLRGRDGRVRVTDFGLAALVGEAGSEPVGGTPGYIAPEQLAGAPIDAACDQFSFCVTAWEMLAGARPFATTTADVASKGPAPAPSIPPAVRRVLLRGLAVTPADRYPSMDALLAALAATTHRKRGLIALGAGTVVALALGAAAWARTGDDACSGATRRLAGVWDGTRRATVRAAFRESPTFERFAAVLDDRANRWVATHTDACRATRDRKEQSPQLMDARMRCLDEQLGAMRALVDVAQAGASPDRALDAAHRLPEPSACTAAAIAARGKPVTFAEPLATVASELDRTLDQAQARLAFVDLPAADKLLVRAEQLIGAIPDPVREARTAFYRGRYLLAKHDPERARAAFTRAALVGARAQDRRLVGAAAANLVQLLANNTNRDAEAVAWEATLEVQLAAGGGDELLADLEESRCVKAFNRRDYRAARDHAARAVELYEQVAGRDKPNAITALQLLARATEQLEGKRAAEPIYRRTIAIIDRAYGPEHPLMATTLDAMATYTMEVSHAEKEQARKTFERVLAIRERAYGPNHPLVAEVIGKLGVVSFELGDLARAQTYMERALALAQQDGDELALADPLLDLATLHAQQGHLDDARREIARVISIVERAHGVKYPGLLGPLIRLGELELKAKGCATAAPLFERAYRVIADGEGDAGPVSYALLQLTMCELELGHAARALAFARTAHERRTAAGMPPQLLAESRFTLAQALERSGKRADAIAEAERAHSEANPEFRSVIEPWLRDMRAGRRPALAK